MLISFQNAIPFFAVILTLLFIFLMKKISRAKRFEKRRRKKKTIETSLSILQYSLLSLFSALSILAVGQRGELYFVILALIFINTIILSRYKSRRHSITLYLTPIVVVACLVIGIVNVHNISFIGTDQWREFIGITSISETHSIEEFAAISSSYYTPFPVLPLLGSQISTITGLDVFESFFLFTLAASISIVLILFVIIRRLTGSNVPALISFFLLISTPRLALWEMIPIMFSVGLGLLFILMFVLSTGEKRREVALLSPILVFVATAAHAVAALLIFSIPLGLLLMRLMKNTKMWSTHTSHKLLNAVVISFTYWTFTVGLFQILKRVERIPSIGTRGPFYTPLHFEVGWIQALPWALVASLAAAYFICKWRPKRKFKFNEAIILAASITGGIALITGFSIITLSPQVTDFQRYLGFIGYPLLLFPASILAYKLLNKGKLAHYLVILILFVNLLIGSTSINWAPDLNPTYQPTRRMEYDIASFLHNRSPSRGYFLISKGVASPFNSIRTYSGMVEWSPGAGSEVTYFPRSSKPVRTTLRHIADNPEYIKMLSRGEAVPILGSVDRNDLAPLRLYPEIPAFFLPDTKLMYSSAKKLHLIPGVDLIYVSSRYMLLRGTE